RLFFFSSRRRHTRFSRDWSSDVCSSDLCRMWSKDGVPSPHLEVFQDKSVFVMLDADASSNLNVYEAGTALHSALSMFGATEVRFVRLPGGKTVGLDDLLGKQKFESRSKMIYRMIKKAEDLAKNKAEKPADAKPASKNQAPEPPPKYDKDGRYNVVVNGDAQAEMHGILTGIKSKWD